MTAITASWRLHRNAPRTALRATLLLTTGAFAILVRLLTIATSEAMYFYLFATTVAYVGICALIIQRHFREQERHGFVFVRAGMLCIPRFIWPSHVIPLNEIKSIEKYGDSRGAIAVLVGRLNKSSILIERRIFDSEEEFEGFMRFLANFPRGNLSKQSSEEMAAITARGEPRKLSLTAVLAVAFSATYIVVAEGGIEEITENAMIQGGLIKETLQTSQFYRIASSFFLHLSPLHLIVNVLSLAILGKYVNVIFGPVRYINICFFSAISGSLLSLVFSPSDLVVGASGGIMGLFGAYFLVCIKYLRRLPGSVSVSTRAIPLVLAFQILFELFTTGVDTFSHLGGFAFGVLYASAALYRCTAGKAAKSSIAERCAAASAALAYTSGLIYFFAVYF